MIGHIVKKDFRLVRSYAVVLATVQVAAAVLRFRLGPFTNLDLGTGRAQLMYVLEGLVLLGTGFLITLIVQQDAIPGVRQDWLIRPISRRDMLAAKIVSVLLMVHGPMLVADLLFGLVNGVSVGRSLAVAFSQNIFVFAILSLPLLALASLTRNMMESMAGLLGAFACAFLIQICLVFVVRPPWETGGTWIPWSGAALVLFLGSVAVMGVQYFRRTTRIAIALSSVVLVLAVLTTGMFPAGPAFAMEKWLSREPGTASGLTFSFDSAIEPYHGIREGYVTDGTFYIPLRIAGLPPDTFVNVDRSQARLVDQSEGSIRVNAGFYASEGIKKFRQNGTDYFKIEQHDGSAIDSDRLVQLEFDWHMTLFRRLGSKALPTVHGDERIPGLGRCATMIDSHYPAVRFGCLEVGKSPECLEVNLMSRSGLANPSEFFCGSGFPDYTPYFGQLFGVWSDINNSVGFDHPAGQPPLPVEGRQVTESQLRFQWYESVDHFERKLVVPNVRLGDWAAK